jgi:NTP pyrophosphatase (non-canonical NTP hydrolase)
MHLRDLQKHAVETGKIVFGERNVDDQRERSLRFFEEACELIRAARLPYSDACALLAHEYRDRKVGELSQEIAGVQCTLLSLAASHKVDAEEVTLKELARVLDKRDECRAKHDAKTFTAIKVTAA